LLRSDSLSLPLFEIPWVKISLPTIAVKTGDMDVVEVGPDQHANSFKYANELGGSTYILR